MPNLKKQMKKASKGPGPGYKANPKNLKKTTKKGAYAKNAKKNFSTRRAPLVETKVREDYEVAARNLSTDPRLPVTVGLGQPGINWISIPVHCYNRISMGIREDQIVGRAEYGKYLKMKGLIRFPNDRDQITTPFELSVVHGWITQPLGATSSTSPSEAGMTGSDLTSHVNAQLSQYFDSQQDKLSFISPATISGVKILRNKKVSMPRRNLLTPGPGSQFDDDDAGGLPDYYFTCSWRIMRKITRSIGSPGAANDNSDSTDTQNLYPNRNWIPFVYLYTPTPTLTTGFVAAGAADAKKISVGYNSAYWFTDS